MKHDDESDRFRDGTNAGIGPETDCYEGAENVTRGNAHAASEKKRERGGVSNSGMRNDSSAASSPRKERIKMLRPGLDLPRMLIERLN